MANYAVTTYQTATGTLAAVILLIKTKLETINNGKTIRSIEYVQVGNNPAEDVSGLAAWQGVLIYDT